MPQPKRQRILDASHASARAPSYQRTEAHDVLLNDIEQGYDNGFEDRTISDIAQNASANRTMQSIAIPGATVTMPMPGGRRPTRRRTSRRTFRRTSRRGSSRRRRFSGRPRGFPRSTFGEVYVPRGTEEGIAKYGISNWAATPEQRVARATDGWRGAGDYYSGQGGFFRGIGRGIRSIANRAMANPIIRGIADAKTGGMASMGMDAMNVVMQDGVTENAIVNNGGHFEVPTFGSNDFGTITMSHKEYLQDIYGPPPGTFQNTTFALNPGQAKTFPWLHQIAANYEEYEFEQLIFTYRSTITDFVSTNGQVGMILMATQYNAESPAFTNKQDMLEYEFAMSGKTSKSMLHGVECDPAQSSGPSGKYIRLGPAPPNEDLKTYDLGQLNVAVSNLPKEFQGQSLGEIWVSYTVKLRKPKFVVARNMVIPRDWFCALNPLSAAGNWNTYANVFANQQNRIGGTLAANASVVVRQKDLYTNYSGNAADFFTLSNVISYTFPPNYNGAVKVMFRSTTSQASNTGTTTWIYTTNGVGAGALSSTTYTAGTPGAALAIDLISAESTRTTAASSQPVRPGNGITPIYDVYMPATKSWACFRGCPLRTVAVAASAPSEGALAASATVCELHLQINSQYTGATSLTDTIPNTIYFATNNFLADTSQTGYELDIQGYNNSQFNYPTQTTLLNRAAGQIVTINGVPTVTQIPA